MAAAMPRGRPRQKAQVTARSTISTMSELSLCCSRILLILVIFGQLAAPPPKVMCRYGVSGW